MNVRINAYFDEVEARFLSSPVVTTFQIVRRDISPTDGILRIKADLSDLSLAEFFEYAFETDSKIEIKKYSFHWQDKDGNLVRRWDNAPHHKISATHDHVHDPDGSIKAVTEPLNIIDAILEIEIEISNKRD